MKKAGIIAASIAAASSAALASTADCSAAIPNHSNLGVASVVKDGTKSGPRKGEEDKLAPRFDGLRFIETLVTAHR